MNVLFDITHPAHVHFFRNPIKLLQEAGHQVSVTTRDKDCTLELLDRFGIDYQCISKQNSGKVFGMARELIARDYALLKAARTLKPDVLAAVGGIWAAHVGWLMRRPSVIFYDTETARVQNALTYPFATRIVVPRCYKGKLPEKKTVRYNGYHELSYLHPDYFTPSREIALANGLAPSGDTFLIRLVSWKASHDIGLKGWSRELLDAVVQHLAERGHVVISAEGELPSHLEALRYAGDPVQLHHLLGHCRACIGESATMTSEAAVLGVPAIYVATESRGYVDEQCAKYKMVTIVPPEPSGAVALAIQTFLATPKSEIESLHSQLIGDTADVNTMIVKQLFELAERQ